MSDNSYKRVRDAKLGDELTIRAVSLGNGLIAIPKYNQGQNVDLDHLPKGGTQKITLDEHVQVRVTNELSANQKLALEGLFGGDDDV